MSKRIVPISKGKFTILDETDAQELTRWKWKLHPQGYAARTSYKNKKFVTLLLHRVVMNAPDGIEVDHINGNKLDNRKCNLRLVTRGQNEYYKNPDSRNTSGHRGICWDSGRNKWMVRCSKKYIGRYEALEEAIEARNAVVPQVVEVIGRAIMECKAQQPQDMKSQ